MHDPGGPGGAAGPGDSKADAAELLAVLGAVRRIVRRAARQALHSEPLPPARSELLRLAARTPGISVADAARELGLAPNSVSTMVSKLTADGLLNRGRGEEDARSARLLVTSSGMARIAQWRDVRSELTGRALAQLPVSDRHAIAAAIPALARLAARLGEL